MPSISSDTEAFDCLKQLAQDQGLDIRGGKVRRTSSRFCLGVEHGDYNGTELFGVGTDRFIWMAYKANGTHRMRLFSGNFPKDGMVAFTLGEVPSPQSPEIADTWARFPLGVNHVLDRAGYKLTRGFDAVLYGNIPGGGMSRSASLTLNLILSLLDVNDLSLDAEMTLIDLAQAVENDYIGSPCGQLDQIMHQINNADRVPHVQHVNRTTLTKHARLNYELNRFRDGHKESLHFLMSYGDGSARSNLLLKERDYTAPTSHHVAEANTAQASLVASPSGLDHQLRQSLTGPHNIGGLDSFVGRDRHETSDSKLNRQFNQRGRSKNIV